MRSAVAVTVGNRHIGQVSAAGKSRQVDCHLSAQQLSAALQTRGLRVDAPWIDQPGGAPMLDRLRQVLASEVRPTDDGFVFCFCGHGGATELLGNNNIRTSYQDIINVIDIERKLQGKPKLIVFDCCQGNAASDPGHLRVPKDTILAFATALSTRSWAQGGVGNVYSNRLAAAIHSHAATHSVEDLLKLTQGQVHGERIITEDQHGVEMRHQQIAHVDSALGAYHLFLGDAP